MTEPVDFGRLRHRLRIEAPVETPDGAGGVTRAYQTVDTVWASVDPLHAGPVAEAGIAGQAVTWRITVRRRADLSSLHRLQAGARTFLVRSFHDTADLAFTLISAEEISA